MSVSLHSTGEQVCALVIFTQKDEQFGDKVAQAKVWKAKIK